MLKAKIYSFAIACMVGAFGISPVTTFAAETNIETVTVSESKNGNNNRAAFEEKMIKASEKWNTLSDKQKQEVYSLLENEIKDEGILMDKLVELGVFEKADVDMYKTRLNEKFNQLKQSGEFPFFKQNGTRKK